jgi:hypothetical protein
LTPVRPDVERFLLSRFPGAGIEPMAGDASTRRFLRLTAPSGTTRVVMDYGAPFQETTDDVRVAELFFAAGLPVARVIEVAPAAGCLVLEDLGDRTLEVVLDDLRRTEGVASPAARRLYESATDLAAAIATRGTEALLRSDRAAGPALDSERLRFEMDFFVANYVGRFLGLAPPAVLKKELHDLADRAASERRVLCHRDFHSRNLIVRRDGSLSMVDIQDARWGPDSYDLASLARDAYADDPDPWIEEMIERYHAAVPGLGSLSEFRVRFDVVATQRMVKALGTFGYQVASLGRARYRSAIPRTLARLSASMRAAEGCLAIHRIFSDLGLFSPPSADAP